MLMTEAPRLDYSPRLPPWHRRPSVRRWTVRLVLLAAVLLAGFRWGPPASRQVRLYLAQRRCLAYLAPAGQLIYSSDQADPFARDEANALKQAPPACWAALEAGIPAPVALPLNHEPYLDSQFEPLADAPVFLHRRRVVGGAERMVVAQFGGQALGGKRHRVLCCRVIRPATLFHGPELLWEGSTILVGSFNWTAAVRVHAGKVDGANPARFTIDVDVDGVREVVDGELQRDDTVKVHVPD